MIDMFNTPSDKVSAQVFYFAGAGAWQMWQKPTNATFVYMFVIGGGSGGGGGRTSAILGATGGGGGASSSTTHAVYAANMIPDTLYLQVGAGGAGGVNQGTGVAGGLSYVSFDPDTTAINILLQSGAAGATGGIGSGSSSTGATGGTGGTSWGFATAINGNIGLVDSNPGQNGTAGTGSGASPQNLTFTTILSGGAGGGAVSGGGTTYNGGSILASSITPLLSPGVMNAADSTAIGSHGVTNLFGNTQSPMFFTGGAGGAATSTTARKAGAGGNGAYGCGGGGGGGAYNATGGDGGKGGDGLIMIVCV